MLTSESAPGYMQLTARKTLMIQTQNAVSIAASASSTMPSTWIDCAGFYEVSGSLINDAGTTSSLNLQWSHDGISVHGEETVVPTGTSQVRGPVRIPVKARYVKAKLFNGDTGAAHTMSAWIFFTT